MPENVSTGTPDNERTFQDGTPIPPWQVTADFTIKGTEDECQAKLDKLRAYARRIGVPEPFVESEPNCDLDYRNA